MKVLVSTDTSCLIDYQTLKKYEISIFPLNVIIDGEEYLDGITINQDQLRDAMRANKKIKTSTPPLGEIIEYFEGLFAKGYDHIIHFTISSKLSSMNSLFNNVASDHFAGKITVIDSYSLSSLMLSHVLFAYDEVQKGTDPEKIKELVEERKQSNCIVFIPENLTALKNGGRVSPAIATIGNIIGIKPLMTLQDGKLDKEGMVRNSKKAILDKITEFSTTMPLSDYDYFLLSFDANPATLDYLKAKAAELLGENALIDGVLPINVCAHCGPGTVGLIASPKINGKSLHEYIK